MSFFVFFIYRVGFAISPFCVKLSNFGNEVQKGEEEEEEEEEERKKKSSVNQITICICRLRVTAEVKGQTASPLSAPLAQRVWSGGWKTIKQDVLSFYTRALDTIF